jgi:chromosome partitioning protein
MDDKQYKPVEAARILGVSKDFLLSCEREGRIPPSQRDEFGNRVYSRQQIERIRDLVGVRPQLSHSPVVLGVFNMKGGVGKSTVSANLAWKLAEKGFRILGLDADPQGHLTTSLGFEPADFQTTLMELLIPGRRGETTSVAATRQEASPNLHIIPANLSMCQMNLLLFQQPEREYRLRHLIEAVRETHEYDVVIVDSPPSYDLTSLNILLASDVLIAPVKLDGNSFYGLQYLFETIHEVSRIYRYTIPRVLIVPNHYNGSFSVSRQILDGLNRHYGPYLTRSIVRQDVNFDKANALRQPIFLIAPSSRGSKDLEGLSDEIVDLLTAASVAQNSAA